MIPLGKTEEPLGVLSIDNGCVWPSAAEAMDIPGLVDKAMGQSFDEIG